MRVLVTGAGGFVGGHVLTACPPDWDVVAVSRRQRAPTASVRTIWLADAFAPLPDQLTGPFDAIIHLAGNADHGLAGREPWADLAATGGIAGALLGRIQAGRVVVLSSAAVYAGLHGRVDPRTPVEPPMPYALSKLYVEGFVRALLADRRIDAGVVLRLYNAYGPGERPTRLVPRVAEAVRTGSPFVLTGAVTSLSDPLHVGDVARALVAAVALPTYAGVLRTFDLCGGDPRPLREQAGRIAAALGGALSEVRVAPDPLQVPIQFWSDPAQTIAGLGLGSVMSLDEGVRRYAAAEGWTFG